MNIGDSGDWRLSEKHRFEYDALFLRGRSRSGIYIRIDHGELSGGRYIERIKGKVSYEEEFSATFESCDSVWDHLLENTDAGETLARLLFERFKKKNMNSGNKKQVILTPIVDGDLDSVRFGVEHNGKTHILSIRDLRSLGISEERINEALDGHYL